MNVVWVAMQLLIWIVLFVSCMARGTDRVYHTMQVVDIKMPDVQPAERESYLCRSVPIDTPKQNYIVKFVPHANKRQVHHMILYGCMTPGLDDEVWNCGGMHTTTIVPQYRRNTVCGDGRTTVLYAWAMDAPELQLPEGVGFRVGGDSKVQYLVLQVHYLEPPTRPDHSGLTVHMTDAKLPKTAGILFMASLGRIRAHTKENFEVTCIMNDKLEVNPFAYRVHTHRLGKLVSGYVVRNKEWLLLGKKDPQKPQMFYPVADNSMTIRYGDIVTARCSMENLLDKDVYIGSTSEDEMCNFYVMYWSHGNKTLSQESCTTWGPPNYYWAKDKVLANSNIPEIEASVPIENDNI